MDMTKQLTNENAADSTLDFLTKAAAWIFLFKLVKQQFKRSGRR